MNESQALILIAALVVVGFVLRLLTRRDRVRGQPDERLAQPLSAVPGQELDVVGMLTSQGWLWPFCAAGQRPAEGLDTGASARDPAGHPHVEVVPRRRPPAGPHAEGLIWLLGTAA